MAARFKTDWVPPIKFPIQLMRERRGEHRDYDWLFLSFRGTWEDLRAAGFVEDFILDLIPPSGRKRLHTPVGYVDVERMKYDWRARMPTTLLAKLQTNTVLRAAGINPLDGVKLEPAPYRCFEPEYDCAYDR